MEYLSAGKSNEPLIRTIEQKGLRIIEFLSWSERADVICPRSLHRFSIEWRWRNRSWGTERV